LSIPIALIPSEAYPSCGLVDDTTATGYRVHAVRFYNRQLTPGEIAKNARQDGYRYFGKTAPGTVIVIR
jgi:hypothetical protein